METKRQRRKWRVNAAKTKRQTSLAGSKTTESAESSTRVADVDGDIREIFPGCVMWILHVLVLAGRLYVCDSRSHWWILHPDEVFQAVEGNRVFNNHNYFILVYYFIINLLIYFIINL